MTSPSRGTISLFSLVLFISLLTFTLASLPPRFDGRKLEWNIDRGVTCASEASLLLEDEEYLEVSDREGGGAAIFFEEDGVVEEVEEDACLE